MNLNLKYGKKKKPANILPPDTPPSKPTSVFYLPLPRNESNNNNKEDFDFLDANEINYIAVHGIYYLLGTKLVLHRSDTDYTGAMIYDLSADGHICLSLRYPEIVRSSMHISSRDLEPLITKVKNCVEILLNIDRPYEDVTDSASFCNQPRPGFTDTLLAKNPHIAQFKEFIDKADFTISFETYIGESWANKYK